MLSARENFNFDGVFFFGREMSVCAIGEEAREMLQSNIFIFVGPPRVLLLLSRVLGRNNCNKKAEYTF